MSVCIKVVTSLSAGTMACLVLVLARPAQAERNGVDTFHNPSTVEGHGVMRDHNGYKGIWYDLGQANLSYGSKYSGGLATYPANMFPIATYSVAVNKTFFVYGGTTADDEKNLQIMCAFYDHTTGMVPVPTLVRDSGGFQDAHANPAIAIDDSGYVWIFSATRGKQFEGRRYRSRQPYDIAAFDQVDSQYMAYPQPWHMGTNGFMFVFTQYTGGRELFFQTSVDGYEWTPPKKYVGFSGHYQNSMIRGNRLGTAFNYHPGGSVDRRTNLYYMQTDDMGQSWTTAGGTPLTIPLHAPDNPARVIDYASRKRLVYIHDTNLDASGHPAILYLTSQAALSGPDGDPRTWHVTHWDGAVWHTSTITQSHHNYDVGCLHIDDKGTWRVIGPTATGPQQWGTGGEMEMWISTDEGGRWTREAVLTSGSTRNHTYVRRPVPAHPDFYAFWADGHTEQLSVVNLYFATQSGEVYQLPRTMTNSMQRPLRVR